MSDLFALIVCFGGILSRWCRPLSIYGLGVFSLGAWLADRLP